MSRALSFSDRLALSIGKNLLDQLSKREIERDHHPKMDRTRWEAARSHTAGGAAIPRRAAADRRIARLYRGSHSCIRSLPFLRRPRSWKNTAGSGTDRCGGGEDTTPDQRFRREASRLITYCRPGVSAKFTPLASDKRKQLQ